MQYYWTITIVTDTGKRIPHYTYETRKSCTEGYKHFKDAYPWVQSEITITVRCY